MDQHNRKVHTGADDDEISVERFDKNEPLFQLLPPNTVSYDNEVKSVIAIFSCEQ